MRYLHFSRLHAEDVTEFTSFESSGTAHKQLTFSEFRGTSYTTEVSDKFTEYLKLCYRGYSCFDVVRFLFTCLTPAAKEKRRCYTLSPTLDAIDTPSKTSSTPAVPSYSQDPPAVAASRPPLVTGPDRSHRVTRQARLKAGRLPSRSGKQVLVNDASVIPPQATTASVDTPTTAIRSVGTPVVGIPLIAAPQIDASQPQANAPATNPSGPVEPNAISTPNHPSDTTTSVPDDCASDGGSYTSTLLDVFDVEMDDSGPQATGPWIAIDHLTGKMIVDDDDPAGVVPANTQTEIEVGILPRLGVHILTETKPPTLLFEDEDVRPEWLITAVKEFLRYTPYYGCLGKVIDLFLTQEERLGYPNLVIHLRFSSKYSFTNTMPSPCVELFPPPIGPPKWGSSRSGPENILAATMWTLRSLVHPSSSGGSPSNQPRGSSGHQPTIHSRVIFHLTTSIAVGPMARF